MCVNTYRWRINPEGGFISTNRALRTDELFQVVIDDVLPGSSHSFQIGFILIDTENNADDQQTWMLSSSSISYNNQPQQKIDKLNLDDLQVRYTTEIFSKNIPFVLGR